MKRAENHCSRCRVRIRAFEATEKFLIPKPDGQVKMVCMHALCAAAWSKIAATPEYSQAFYRKAAA